MFWLVRIIFLNFKLNLTPPTFELLRDFGRRSLAAAEISVSYCSETPLVSPLLPFLSASAYMTKLTPNGSSSNPLIDAECRDDDVLRKWDLQPFVPLNWKLPFNPSQVVYTPQNPTGSHYPPSVRLHGSVTAQHLCIALRPRSMLHPAQHYAIPSPWTPRTCARLHGSAASPAHLLIFPAMPVKFIFSTPNSSYSRQDSFRTVLDPHTDLQVCFKYDLCGEGWSEDVDHL